jgi:hypothetical protein
MTPIDDDVFNDPAERELDEIMARFCAAVQVRVARELAEQETEAAA